VTHLLAETPHALPYMAQLLHESALSAEHAIRSQSLPADQAERLNEASTKAAFEKVLTHFIVRIPGEAWAKTEAKKQRFALLS